MYLRGVAPLARRTSPAYAVPCPRCLAPAGEPCRTQAGQRMNGIHAGRLEASAVGTRALRAPDPLRPGDPRPGDRRVGL